MEVVKKMWPISFKVKKNSYLSFFLCFFVYVAVCFGLQVLSGFAADIAILGKVLYVIYVVVDVYSVAGVVMCVCRLFGVKPFNSDEK